MIKFENTEVMNFEGAIRGMRNPLNSWDKSDSYPTYDGEDTCYFIGEKDMNLAQRLIKAGSDHRKFLRQIVVSVDIIAPLYWWKEFDTYKVGTVVNSCSTMHRLMEKPFTIDDFSFEKVKFIGDKFIRNELEIYNTLRDAYLNFDEYEKNGIIPDKLSDKKDVWYALIQILPSSYNQRRTVTLNYETLYNIYHSRRNHKLDEWSTGFMDWIGSLPYANDLLKI